MQKRYLPKRSLAVGLISLLLAGFILAACGGAAEPTSEATTAPTSAPAKSEEATGSTTDVEGEGAEEQGETATEEEAEAEAEATASEEATEEAEAASDENLLAPGQNLPSSQARCQGVDIPDNPFITAVSDDDWVKGPADAPVTLIEYGDFQ